MSTTQHKYKEWPYCNISWSNEKQLQKIHEKKPTQFAEYRIRASYEDNYPDYRIINKYYTGQNVYLTIDKNNCIIYCNLYQGAGKGSKVYYAAKYARAHYTRKINITWLIKGYSLGVIDWHYVHNTIIRILLQKEV